MDRVTNATPTASVIATAHSGVRAMEETIRSILRQTFVDWELIIVDDGSNDGLTSAIEGFDDERIRLVQQKHATLAGARNAGIAHARGRYIGFCDAGCLWLSEKLERHIAHFEHNPDLGISFAGATTIDAEGRPTGVDRAPRLKHITAEQILKRNPIGAGTAAIIRREALDNLAYRPADEHERDWWFDETLRHSDDIECWLRFVLTSDWLIEGIAGLLTLHRVPSGELPASLDQQFETWVRMTHKIASISPDLVHRHGAAATAYRLRDLCRRAVSMREGRLASRLARRSIRASLRPFLDEPLKTVLAVVAAEALKLADGSISRWWVESPLPSVSGSST